MLHKHLSCFSYDKNETPLIEVRKFGKVKNYTQLVEQNDVIIVTKGSIQFTCNNLLPYEGKKGDMAFLAAGNSYCYSVDRYCELIIIRLSKPVVFCRNYNLEMLYHEVGLNIGYCRPVQKKLCVLKANQQMWTFIKGLICYLNDGAKCMYLYDLKIRELFYILRLYYSTDELYNFIYLILGPDMVFSTYIMSNYHKYRNVKELAGSMQYTTKTFSKKFKRIFEKTAYQWMKEQKVAAVLKQIISTDKRLKEVAYDNGFSSMQQLNNFCRKEFGKSPSFIRKNGL